MRRRVNQVLKAGDEWNRTAKQLIEATDNLTKAIENKEVKSTLINPLKKSVQTLSKRTTRLAKAFESYQKILGKIASKVE